MFGFHGANSSDEVHGALEVLELTTVHYRPGDPFSVILAYTTLTPLIILVALITLLLFRRDLRTATLFSGLLLNECLNYVLKKTIKEARPAYLSMHFPSNHLLFSLHIILSTSPRVNEHAQALACHVQCVCCELCVCAQSSASMRST
jgi:hypothetical protein